jgi:hypothetical protein
LRNVLEFGYIAVAVISAQKNADSPVKVSPHSFF